MLRLFIALPVPDEIAARAIAIQRGVPGAKWRPRDTLHVTLRFVGEVDERFAEELDGLLAAIRVKPFALELKGAGSFGGADPHALFLHVDGAEPLRRLAAACDSACRKLGKPPDRERYTPHLTIAYLRGGTDPARVFAFERNQSLFRAGPWIADRFHLYSSWLGKGPSRYVAEAEYPLEG
jgi:RNA 2',3'-cyclic 3'-phosphodiesterase